MKIAGGTTIIYVSEITDVEQEILKTLGFVKTSIQDDNEVWERPFHFQCESQNGFYEINENLVFGANGAIFLKMENGFYIDKNRNEYRFQNNEMIPVLVRNTRSVYPYELTECEYHDELGKEKAYWDYEVNIANDRYVLVRVYTENSLAHIVEDEKDRKVYDYDNHYHSETFDEKSVLEFVKQRFEKEEKDYGCDL